MKENRNTKSTYENTRNLTQVDHHMKICREMEELNNKDEYLIYIKIGGINWKHKEKNTSGHKKHPGSDSVGMKLQKGVGKATSNTYLQQNEMT